MSGQSPFKNLRLHSIIILAIVLLIIAPIVLSTFQVILLAHALINGILALSVGFLLGYIGLLSFGQAAFYGLGAYMIGLVTVVLGWPFWAGLLLALIVPPAAGAGIGFLAAKSRGIYFAMMTLAAGEVLHRYFFYTTYNVPGLGITGGANGITPIPVPVQPPDWIYYVYYSSVFLVLVLYLFLDKVTKSSFGRALQGIRENELRMRFIGYNTYVYKVVAFSMAAFIAGVAGMMNALLHQIAAPESMSWVVSGESVLATFLGGSGTLVGPIVGGIILTYIIDRISRLTAAYLIILGAMVVVIILFAPKGIVMYLLNIFRRSASSPQHITSKTYMSLHTKQTAV